MEEQEGYRDAQTEAKPEIVMVNGLKCVAVRSSSGELLYHELAFDQPIFDAIQWIEPDDQMDGQIQIEDLSDEVVGELNELYAEEVEKIQNSIDKWKELENQVIASPFIDNESEEALKYARERIAELEIKKQSFYE